MQKKEHVVVIGGGLGGLSAAINLAAYKDRFTVTLIEKNTHLGGKLNVIEKEGFSFDLGPSIFTMPHMFEPLFSVHGKTMSDYVTLEHVDPHWRNVFEDGTIIDLEANIEAMKQPPSNLNDKDIEDLKTFLNYTKKLHHFTEKTMFDNQSERKLDTLKYYNPFKIIKDSDMLSTMDEGVRRYISNPYLIDILNFFIKYVGSSPYDAPAVMNLLPYIQWEFGLWYVKGGMYNLAKGFEKLLKELDVTIHKGVEALSVSTDKNTVSHVETDKLGTIEADVVVSNMEVIPFYEKLSKESPKTIAPYKKRYAPACSGFALHLGVNTTYPMLRHHNFFFSNNPKKHFDKIFHERTLTDDPTIYLVAPMKTNPRLGPKGHEIIKILPHIPVIDEKSPFTEADYYQFKENILDKLERMGLKDLRKHIVTEELWTPHTIRDMYYSNQGAIYGVVADKKMNMGFKHPKRSKLYNNLYFVGGSVNPGGGMPMVVKSGTQTSEQILKDRS